MSVIDRSEANSAEEHVLGAVLVKPDWYAAPIAAQVQPADFLHARHREVYAAARDAADAGRRFDVGTAYETMPACRPEIAAAVEVFDLYDEVLKRPLARSILLMQEAAAVFRMARAMEALVQEAATVAGVTDAPYYFARIEQALGSTDPRRAERQTDGSLKSIVLDEIDALEERIKSPHRIVGIPSGFDDLDDLTSGFRPTQLVVCAGRPGMGKSTLGLNIACKAAREGHRTAFFSMEMPANECGQRLLASEARVPLRGIITGDFGGADKTDAAAARITNLAEELRNWPLVIRYRPGLTPARLRAEVRRLKAEGGIELVVVDYLGLMRSDRKADNRQAEVEQISGSLKETAGRLNVAVLALAQLNRESAKTGRKPGLTDLRDSGAIEQDADVVMFLHRPKEDSPATDLLVEKQRNGPAGICHLYLRGAFVRFEPAETRH